MIALPKEKSNFSKFISLILYWVESNQPTAKPIPQSPKRKTIWASMGLEKYRELLTKSVADLQMFKLNVEK